MILSQCGAREILRGTLSGASENDLKASRAQIINKATGSYSRRKVRPGPSASSRGQVQCGEFAATHTFRQAVVASGATEVSAFSRMPKIVKKEADLDLIFPDVAEWPMEGLDDHLIVNVEGAYPWMAISLQYSILTCAVSLNT